MFVEYNYRLKETYYHDIGFSYEDGKGVRFERDFDGRIIKISDDLGHERGYTYDAEGNRLNKTESKAVKSTDETTGEVTTTWEETDKTYYVMDTSGTYAQVIAELDAERNIKALYTRGDGILSRDFQSDVR